MTRKIPPLIPEIGTDKCVMFCVTNYADTRKSARAVGPGTDCAQTHATEAEAGAEQSGFEPHLDFGQRLDSNRLIVKLRRGSGKDRQGMAPKANGLKAYTRA